MFIEGASEAEKQAARDSVNGKFIRELKGIKVELWELHGEVSVEQIPTPQGPPPALVRDGQGFGNVGVGFRIGSVAGIGVCRDLSRGGYPVQAAFDFVEPHRGKRSPDGPELEERQIFPDLQASPKAAVCL